MSVYTNYLKQDRLHAYFSPFCIDCIWNVFSSCRKTTTQLYKHTVL